jgi:hypothetical protein
VTELLNISRAISCINTELVPDVSETASVTVIRGRREECLVKVVESYAEMLTELQTYYIKKREKYRTKNINNYRSPVRVQIGMPNFSNLPNPSGRIRPWGSLSLLTEMCTGNIKEKMFLGSIARPVSRADNLTAICEPIA